MAATTASLTTDATIQAGRLDVTLAARLEGDMGPFEELLANDNLEYDVRSLDTPARLCLVKGEVIIQCAGKLSEEGVETVVRVLSDLERNLPRRPGSGPQR